MDDRPSTLGAAAGAGLDPQATRPGGRGFGLSWKLLVLTFLFVMATAVLIYVPSIANFRMSWLADRLSMADTATVVLAASAASDLPRDIQDDLLEAVGAKAIVIRNGSISRLIAAVEVPPAVDGSVDLNVMDPLGDIVAAFDTIASAGPRIIRVVGASHNGSTIEMLIGETPLRQAMVRYSINVLWISALISLVLSALLYLSLNRLFVKPMRRLSANMVAFSDAPDDPSRVIRPSGRTDEIGVAEEQLAGMQRELQATLSEQRHLADLGLAVSKINHDLRNMLASAQLFSDRISSLPDPTVQRFAPKLIGALDRAIAYCQSTLAYGAAREAAPARRLVALDRLVDDVADVLGLAGHATIAFDNRVPKGLEVDADPEQLFRVLLNLCRNAIQALEQDADPALVRRLAVAAARENGAVRISVEDTGPGVPERAKAHLFQAFQGSARPGGTGLGLAIAAELVRAHGGAIALADRPGPGARFDIVIPDRRGATGRSGS